MAKYVKLGKKAECFYDSYVKLKVLKREVIELTKKQEVSPKVRRAIQTGHLEVATKDDYNDYIGEVENPKEETEFDEMTKKELTDYYKQTFEVSEEEVVAFSKKTKEKMIEELEELE